MEHKILTKQVKLERKTHFITGKKSVTNNKVVNSDIGIFPIKNGSKIQKSAVPVKNKKICTLSKASKFIYLMPKLITLSYALILDFS